MSTEYPKIETLYERDEKTHKLKPELILKNRVYGCVKTWQFTEKIDGTNIRCMWQPNIIDTPESLTFGGRTDNAQIPADLIKWLYENVKVEKLREVFPATPVVIYGEGYGAGIQKGGDYSPTKKFIVFDVFIPDDVNSRFGGWWLNQENVNGVAASLGLDVVPLIGEWPLDVATEVVRAGFYSHIGEGKKQAEGLVGRPLEPLFDKKGHRLIIKLKSSDF